VATLFAAMGCASATHTSFRDPAYAANSHRDFANVAVFVVGMDPDNAFSVENEVCARLAPAQCLSGKKLLPPAQTYSPADISQALTKANVDGVLVVVLGTDQTASAYLGSVLSDSSSLASPQSGTASLYRNLASWNASPEPTTADKARVVPIYTYDRRAHAVVSLIDRSRGKTVWGGQLNVSATGEASVLDKDFVDAATKELAAQLRQNRLIRIPATTEPRGASSTPHER